MERNTNFKERPSFSLFDYFTGDWNLFQKVLGNPETIFVYDIDGILADTPEVVLRRFTQKYGIPVSASEIDKWDYLSGVAKKAGLSEEVIKHIEDDWFDPKVLLEAKRCLYVRPTVLRTVGYYGASRNFVLTSRNPNLKDSTIEWFNREIPEITKENILIRESGGVDLVNSAKFKVGKLQGLARTAPWVVFVDDSTDFVRAALSDGIQNCLVVNIPQGKTMPDFSHERLIIFKRHPEEYQAMYPFMYAVNRAIGGF